jgi:hypothetical protein
MSVCALSAKRNENQGTVTRLVFSGHLDSFLRLEILLLLKFVFDWRHLALVVLAHLVA